MFVAIQKIKTGEHIEQKETEQGVVDIVIPEYSDHLAFVAETREELEDNDFITYDRIEEYEFAEMYNGIIYTDKDECKTAKNESIKQARATQYATLIDTLHAEKQRKVVLGTWTEEMEVEYVAKVKELTEQIQTENPYIDNVEVLH